MPSRTRAVLSICRVTLYVIAFLFALTVLPSFAVSSDQPVTTLDMGTGSMIP
jgi:hypothetical protein